MGSRKYKYTGNTDTQVVGFGIVKPMEVFKVDFEIKNVNFEEQKVEVKEPKKKEKK